MKLVMDTQIRLTTFTTNLRKKIFLDTLENTTTYFELNDTTIFIWDYMGILDNEKVFNSFCIIDNIVILLDSEIQLYEAYRDGKRFDHPIFNDLVKWIKIKYGKDKKRLLRKMKLFREDLLEHNLESKYYRGIFSDRFSVTMRGQEILMASWNEKDDTKLLGFEENFSFFLKLCKLVL